MQSVNANKSSNDDAVAVRAPMASSSGRLDGAIEWLLRPSVLLRLCIVLLAALYLRTVTFDFVYDDLTLVINPWMQSWKALPAIFTHDIFGFPGGTSPSVYYRPFPVAMALAVMQLTGGAPGMYHLLAVVMHIVVFYAAYVFGRMFLRDERLALFAALVYALHPTKVESVAWIGSSLCDATSGALFFTTLICYLKWREHRSRVWLAVSVLAFTGALFTKETMLVLPALIALHFWLTAPREKRIQHSAALLLPFAAVLAGYLFIRHLVLSAAGTNYSPPSMAAIWSAPIVCWWYLKHLLVPVGLSVVYDPNIITSPTLKNFFAPALALLVLCALLLWGWSRKRSTNAAILAAWFVLALAPSVVMSLMVRQHDRYLYLAAYPFCLLVAYLLMRGAPCKNWVRVSVAFALLMFYVGSTWRETTVWDSGLALWTQAARIAPNSIEPRIQLAYAYCEQFDVSSGLRVLDEALQMNPNSPSLWQTKGEILYKSKRTSEARKAFLKVMDAGSDFRGRAATAFYLGTMDVDDERLDTAEDWFRQAAALEPDNSNYHRALSDVLSREGRADEAREQQRIASEISRRTASRKF